MNAHELFRLRVQSLLARGLGASQIAREVGLVGASEVWGGDAPRELPAWYVWLRQRPGAWQLELAAAARLENLGANTFSGAFAVRYYPSPREPDYGCFSGEERSCAAACFDATGTPRIALASTIPPSFFTVGSIDWTLDLDAGASLVTMSSLDRLRRRSDAGSAGGTRPVLLRDVPGWRLTAEMFSALAGLHAQVERRAAVRLVVTRRAGFELVHFDDRVEARETTETRQGEALLLLTSGPGRSSGPDLLDALRDGHASVLSDLSFGACHPTRVLQQDPDLPLTVSHTWLGGEEHAADSIACAC